MTFDETKAEIRRLLDLYYDCENICSPEGLAISRRIDELGQMAAEMVAEPEG